MKKYIIIFLMVILMSTVVSARNYGEGRYGLGLYGIGEDLPVVAPPGGGGQTGDRTPEEIAMDFTPSGKDECEEKEFIFYENECYECNNKQGRLVFNPETEEIFCQTCGEGYLISEDGKCVQISPFEGLVLSLDEIKEIVDKNPLLALLFGVVVIGISTMVYKENEEMRKKVKKFLKVRKDKEREEGKEVE